MQKMLPAMSPVVGEMLKRNNYLFSMLSERPVKGKTRQSGPKRANLI